MEIKKYTKKPVTIEAIQWTGENLKEVISFTGKHPKWDQWFSSWEDYENHVKNDGSIFKIFTLEGVMEATPNDYIIRGVKGEHYPCKPDIFEMTYNPASPVEGEKEELRKKFEGHFYNTELEPFTEFKNTDVFDFFYSEILSRENANTILKGALQYQREKTEAQASRIKALEGEAKDDNYVISILTEQVKALEERLEAAQFPDTEGDGYVFCGKCGQMKN